MKDIFIVIPTLDPEEDIMGKFINDLQNVFTNILVVNDGSNKAHDRFFKNLEKKGLIVLKHYRNQQHQGHCQRCGKCRDRPLLFQVSSKKK